MKADNLRMSETLLSLWVCRWVEYKPNCWRMGPDLSACTEAARTAARHCIAAGSEPGSSAWDRD